MALAPVPYNDPISTQKGTISNVWAAFFRQLIAQVSSLVSGSLTNPMKAIGDIIYAKDSSGTPEKLSGNTTNTKKYLTQTGTGAASAAPAWGTIAAADVPTLNQNTTGTAAGLSVTLAIGSGGTGQTTQQTAIDALTGTQSSGKYLRSDGTHATLASIQAADVPTLNQNTTGTSSNVTGTVAIANGGSGQTSQQAAIDALTGTQSSGKYLRSDGTHATLSSLAQADLPTIALTSDVTGSASGGSISTTIAANVVSNSKLAQMAANTIKGNNTGSTANSLDLTVAQVTAMLNQFTSSLQGLVPGSSGGTANFLRADGSWAAPSVSGTAPTIQKFLSTGTTAGYVFTVTSANATVGATYTNNGHTYTVANTISAGTILFCSGTSAPTASGTLTKASGTGDATITFSAAVAYATYTKPVSPAPLYIKITMAGGGGGGSGSGTSGGGNGGAGTNSYFGANLMNANGGSGGVYQSNATTSGGTASLGSGPVGIADTGGSGGGGGATGASGTPGLAGGMGGSNSRGGSGGGGANNGPGANGIANTGAGGGGGGANAANSEGSGYGGGAGGYVYAIVTSPSASYPYVVGTGGSAGTAGTTGQVGGAGATGLVLIEEFYQ